MAILYSTNAPADPSPWNGNFALISLFGIDQFLAGDSTPTSCTHSNDCNFHLILAIYESGWDKLNTLTDGNFTFRQQVSKQFSGKGNKAKNLGYSKFLGFSLQFLQDSFKAKSICDQNIKKKLENLNKKSVNPISLRFLFRLLQTSFNLYFYNQ